MGGQCRGHLCDFQLPYGVAISAFNGGRFVYVADTNNNRIRVLDLNGINVATLAGSSSTGWSDGVGTNAVFNNPRGIVQHPATGLLYVSDFNSYRIRSVSLEGVVMTVAGAGGCCLQDGAGASALFYQPWGLALNPNLGVLYVADTMNYRLRAVTVGAGRRARRRWCLPLPAPAAAAAMAP